MAIIKQYHRDTNTTYVYESTSYWDAEKQQSRSRRRVIGKIDPETGEVVPTGKRGRKKSAPQAPDAGAAGNAASATDCGALQEEVRRQQIEIRALREQAASLEEENRRLRASLSKAGALAEKIAALCPTQAEALRPGPNAPCHPAEL